MARSIYLLILMTQIAYASHSGIDIKMVEEARERMATQTYMKPLQSKIEHMFHTVSGHPLLKRLDKVLVNPQAWLTQERGVSIWLATLNHARFLARFNLTRPLLFAALIQHVAIPPLPHVTRKQLPLTMRSNDLQFGEYKQLILEGEVGADVALYMKCMRYQVARRQPLSMLTRLSFPTGRIRLCKDVTTPLTPIYSYAWCTAFLVAHHQQWDAFKGDILVDTDQPWITYADQKARSWLKDFKSKMVSEQAKSAMETLKKASQNAQLPQAISEDVTKWNDEQAIQYLIDGTVPESNYFLSET